MDLIAKITALDSSIFIYAGLLGFLLAGIAIKRKPKNFKDYAISIESFSIPTLVATMAATLIGGGSIIGRVSLYYREGLLLLIPGLIGLLDYLILVRYILPRLGNYYGQTSIASVISKIYGTSLVERFAGIVAYIYCFGVLALQVKVIGFTIQYALGFESTTAIIISFAIITTYSAFGGIRSVIRTDVVQFITFIIVLPVMGSFLLQENGGLYAIFEKISWKPSSNFSMLNYICLFIFSFTPNITPICIHRLLVGRSISKNTTTIYLTALLQLLCGVFAVMVAAIAIVKYQNIDGNMAMFKVVGDSMNSNLATGLFAVAMLAVILSSADSLMNTGAVIFVENIIKDTVTDDKKRLLIVKIITILSGFFGLFIALKTKGLLEIIWFITQYYFAIITIPFIGGLFVKNPKPLMFWASAITGFIFFTLFKMFYPENQSVGYVISITMSFIVFVLAHYFVRFNFSSTSNLMIHVKQYIKKIIQEMNIPVSKLGYAIIPILVFTAILEVISGSINSNAPLLKLIAGIISVSFVFIDVIFKKYNKLLTYCYVLFSIWYCFPFLSSYTYYALPNSNIAFANMVISCTFLAFIFSSKILFVFLATGALLGSVVYLMFNAAGLVEMLPQFFILCSIVLYIGIISFFILKAKEVNIKTFISELSKQTLCGRSSTILNQYSNVISVFKKHERAKKIFLEKRQNFYGSPDPGDIVTLNMKDLIETLKDYLSLLELENNVKYSINNKVKNILVSKSLATIYTAVFSIATHMRYFDESTIKIDVSCRHNKLYIKYTLPNLRLDMRELIKYVNSSDMGEGIIDLDLINKIINKGQGIELQTNHNALTLSVLVLSKSISADTTYKAPYNEGISKIIN